MVSFAKAWFADRSPGLGKRLLVNSATVGVNGIVAVGQPTSGGGASTIPASFPALPEPGSAIPPPGAAADRAPYFLVFAGATGFDGYTTLSGWKSGTATGSAVSLSCWINLATNAVLPSVPQVGPLFTQLSGANTSLATLYPGSGLAGTVACAQIDLESGIVNTTTGPYAGGQDGNSFTTGYTYPNRTTSSNWTHLMFAQRLRWTQGSGPVYGYTEKVVIAANDTVLVNSTHSNANLHGPGYIDFANLADPNNRNIGGFGTTAPAGAGLIAGLAEYWLATSFIDWSLASNRAKFHVTDGIGAFQSWAPCDLGPAGRRPGITPLLYLSGAPSVFVHNRADAGATLTTNAPVGHGLFLVDDPPT